MSESQEAAEAVEEQGAPAPEEPAAEVAVEEAPPAEEAPEEQQAPEAEEPADEPAPAEDAEPEAVAVAEPEAVAEEEPASEPDPDPDPDVAAAEAELAEEAIPAPVGPAAGRQAKVFLCDRGHRTVALWSTPGSCHARPTRSGGECGRQLYPIGELPDQVQKALNPLKASKKSSKA